MSYRRISFCNGIFVN